VKEREKQRYTNLIAKNHLDADRKTLERGGIVGGTISLRKKKNRRKREKNREPRTTGEKRRGQTGGV